MKTAALLSILSALATAFLLTTSASANIALPSIELSSQLASEDVDIKIDGDKLVVEPSDKRAIVVEVGKPEAKLP